MANLSLFCLPVGTAGRGPFSEGMETCWQDSGWQYATDGAICVRQPTHLPALADGVKRPGAQSLFNSFPPCQTPWPANDDIEVTKRHPACSAVELTPLMIAGRKIPGRYCLMIQNLGAVRYCADGKPDEPVAFRCGEVQGLVNPLAPE